MLNEIVVILVIRNSFSLNMVSLTVDVCQVYVNIDLSNDNSLIHAARNPKLRKMNSEKKIFFPSVLIQKTRQISLDNFIKKKPHISEDLQHKNQKGIVVAAPLIIIMLEARILIIIKIQESRAQKNDKHIYR